MNKESLERIKTWAENIKEEINEMEVNNAYIEGIADNIINEIQKGEKEK